MQSMSFDPAVAGIGTQIVGSAMQAIGAGASASPTVTALIPAGADEVSALAAKQFAADATQTLALLNEAHAELARMGTALVEIARVYADTDTAAAGRLHQIRPTIGYPLAG
jgi:PE family